MARGARRGRAHAANGISALKPLQLSYLPTLVKNCAQRAKDRRFRI